MSDTNLSSLVVRAQTGDRAAYDDIVLRFQDMAVGYASALLGDFHLAEDAAQEAFVGAWTELPRLHKPAAFPGWFKRIVFMRCSRVLRKRQTVAIEHAAAIEHTAVESLAGSDPVEELESRDEKARVMGAIGRLPDEERMATLLYYISTYSHQEVGSFLGLSASTVNNRLRSARKRLRKEMLKMAEREIPGQAPSRDDRFAQRIASLLQPDDLKTERYQYGIEAVDGHQAWALFCASGAGDLARVSAMLDRDPRLVNAQYWYQFPIHMAVREGHAEVVQLLLQAGADPGQSRYTYNSWDKLLDISQERGFNSVQALLEAAMRERFGYDTAFEELADAIKSRDQARVEKVLAARADLIHASDALGNGPLHWAVITRQNDLVDIFVARGASLEARRADGQTPLLVSLNGDYWFRSRYLPAEAPKDTWVITRHLLACGAEYALSVACAAGDENRVDAVLASNPVLARTLDAGRRSPLAYAAGRGHTQIVEKLLDLGADPNLPEENAPRGGALFGACSGNHIETAKLLLERGADPNAEVDSSGSCLTTVEYNHGTDGHRMQAMLHEYGAVTPPFAMVDDSELERAVREGGAVVSHPQFLHELMGRNNAELINIFLENTPDVGDLFRLTDIWGGNYPSDPDMIRTLAGHGLDLCRANWIGRTFLHGCAEKGDVAAARAFLDLGADIDAIELEYGGTPLAAAARSGKAEMVRFLLDQGANPTVPAESVWAQPLYGAEKEGHGEVVALLRQLTPRPA